MLTRLTRGLGIYLIGGAILSAVLVWLILEASQPIAHNPPYNPNRIPEAVHWVIAYRRYTPLLSLPAFLIGLIVLRTGRRGLLMMLLGVLALLLPFAVVVWCFIALVAPMYEVQELGMRITW